MDKRVFDDAIGELPPSTVRVDEAIARGRRAARIRKVAAPVVGVALTVVLGVGAVAYTTMPEPSSPPASPNRLGTACPSVPKVDEPADEASRRLTQLSRELVGERLPPDARLAEVSPLVFVQSLEEHEEARLDEVGCDSNRYLEYTALADIEKGGRSALLGIDVSLGGSTAERCVSGRFPETICEETTFSEGENGDSSAGVAEGVWTRNEVWVDKPDGTTVHVSVVNDSTSGQQRPLEAPPLSVGQLREIALDPRMTLFP